MSRLKDLYKRDILPKLVTQLSYKNQMQVPKLLKITLNMGLGDCSRNSKMLESSLQDLEAISGQKPVITKARKSVASFKIRQGFPVGIKVTLRSHRMFEFLDRLLNIAIPRIRDFRGLKQTSFDGHGNYSIGISEYIVFPEIQYDKVESMRGLDITITTSAKNNEEALALLQEFQFPFQEHKKK